MDQSLEGGPGIVTGVVPPPAAAAAGDAAAPRVELRQVGWDDADAEVLRVEQQAELAEMYDGEGDIEPELPRDEMVATVLVTVDGEVAGCGSLRDAARYGEGYGELKRMFVRPAFRRRGLSRLVVTELEAIARTAGYVRLILETGVRQQQAIGLYRSCGYRRIPSYGPYEFEEHSVCYGRWLRGVGMRVLVVSGTVGAGKTTIAAEVAAALESRDVPHAWIDVDTVCQVWPRTSEDPFAQQLVFENLGAIAPNLARHGYRHVVLARVVEDVADRERYEVAFDGAEVSVVRLTATEATRLARLERREQVDRWRAWHQARTVELDRVLSAAGTEDAVVENEGRAPQEVAAQVLAEIGW